MRRFIVKESGLLLFFHLLKDLKFVQSVFLIQLWLDQAFYRSLEFRCSCTH